MFGPSRADLKEMLVDCWNLLARVRGERLRYVSIKGGFEWIVVIHNKLDEDAQEIIVVLLNSAAEGHAFLDRARSDPSEFRFWSVHKSLGPYGRGSTENVDRTYDQWLDRLYRDKAQ